jgi:hypothetical protein
MLYTINLNGCDGTTQFTMELNEKEKELVEKIANESRIASPYSCYPTMSLEEGDTVDMDD